MEKNVDSSSIEIRSKKVHQNDIVFLLIKVTSSKVRRNDVDFFPIKITTNKVRVKDVDFLSNSYVEQSTSKQHRFSLS